MPTNRRAQSNGLRMTPTHAMNPSMTASVPPRPSTPAHVPARKTAPNAICAIRKRRNRVSLDVRRMFDHPQPPPSR